MLLEGLISVFTPFTIALILGGVFLGIIFGSIPGMSATMGIALCLPISFGLEPVQGLSLLLGIYIGGISGGLISAILLNMPGTPASIATTFDGYPMAQRGDAGRALGIGIFYSAVGGMASFIALIFIAPPIANFALKFAPYEYFSVAIFALTMLASLAEGNMAKGLLAGMLGISFTLVGAAPIDATKRFTLGITDLDGGFALMAILVGLYAIAEIINISGESQEKNNEKITTFKLKGFGFSIKEFKQQLLNSCRSSAIGTGIGILPGIGGGTSNIISYVVAKKQSKYPDKFGTGIMDGLVASESSNNASIGGALIPLLSLGIPGDTATAMLLGGLMVHGITPGPMLFKTNGSLIYSIFAALIIANIMMLVVEFFGIRIFVRILSVPKNILMPIIVVLCVVGAYAGNNRIFDVYAMMAFGLVGWGLVKCKFPLPPVILGFVLGKIVEANLRRGLMLSRGSFIPFITSPISATFLAIALISVILSIVKGIKTQKN